MSILHIIDLSEMNLCNTTIELRAAITRRRVRVADFTGSCDFALAPAGINKNRTPPANEYHINIGAHKLLSLVVRTGFFFGWRGRPNLYACCASVFKFKCGITHAHDKVSPHRESRDRELDRCAV